MKRFPTALAAGLASGILTLSAAAQQNFLLLVADDMGVDRITAYGESPTPGRTPNLDRLAAGGVLFRNAWGRPFCSPSRATLMTGRYGFRYGWGANPSSSLSAFELALDEVTLPEMLSQGSGGAYASVALGKWHLGHPLGLDEGHPQASGFDFYAGSLANLTGGGSSYFHWPKSINGCSEVFVDRYATSDTANDAVRMVRSLPEPWFAYVAFHAAHLPYHAPPPHLHGFTLNGNPADTPELHHKAMVEALDTEIGRVLEALEPELRARTTIVFVADNGTQNDAVEAPFVDGHGKGTTFEGGLNVPLIVEGPAVGAPGSECGALVDVVDIFATFAELAGIDPLSVLPPGRELDSQSLVPYLLDPTQPTRRTHVFAEEFEPNGAGPYTLIKKAVRGRRFKYVERQGNGRLYDLENDPFESTNLLLGAGLNGQQQRAVRQLKAWMGRLGVN